ncbi:hypothetical protein [Clostridium sp. LCP25S3_F8]
MDKKEIGILYLEMCKKIETKKEKLDLLKELIKGLLQQMFV